MKVLVASKNNAKIEGTRRAFERYFEDVEIEGIAVESDVSEEPMNIEIYDGAKNRIKNLKAYALENKIKADYFVAIESGITNLLGDWQIVSLTVVDDGKTESLGTSAGYPVPEQYVEEILVTNIGKVINDVFNVDGKPTSKGGISVLTHDQVTRYELTEQSVLMSLTKFINEEKWK